MQPLRSLCNDTQGIVLPYVTVMLIVIMGVSLLALDGARFMELQTEVQNRADSLALAAAAELDRTPTAILRARRALQKFGDLSAEDVKIADVRFLSSLPLHDGDPILPANLTTDPTRAAYIEITVQPVSMRTIMPASLFGGSNMVAAGARAVAGFDEAVCNVTPVYVCNPFETSGMSYAQATQALVSADSDVASQRRLIRLTSAQANNGNFGPGTFGYLAPATGSWPIDSCGPPIGNGLGQALAASRPPVCLRLSGVDLQSGNDQAAMDGLNTRFDIYKNGFEACKDNYVADVNVRKGFIAPGNVNWCAARPSNPGWPLPDAQAAALPLDENMTSGAPAAPHIDAAVAIGDGTWDCATYWRQAHYAGPGRTLPPVGCTSTSKISRYSVYQYEMNYISDRSMGGEIGDPLCNPLGVKFRRLIQAAIINCGSNPELMSADARNVPVAAFGKFFLTTPAPAGPTLYAEFVGLMKSTDGVNHDMVQLYR